MRKIHAEWDFTLSFRFVCSEDGIPILDAIAALVMLLFHRSESISVGSRKEKRNEVVEATVCQQLDGISELLAKKRIHREALNLLEMQSHFSLIDSYHDN